MSNSIKRSNAAHSRLYLMNHKKSNQSKDIQSIVKFSTKEHYHRSTIDWQKSLNRKLNKTEKKQLYRAYERRVNDNFGLPNKNYKNQPNYISFK
jgi:hypothetical protein